MLKRTSSNCGILIAKAVSLSFLAVIVWAQVAFATGRNSGAIRGTVADEAGRPIPGAFVEVSGASLGKTRTAATDLKGRYMIPGLSAGDIYQVKVSSQGYGTVVRRQIEVPAGTMVDLPFTLSEAGTSVEVTAAPPPSRLRLAPSSGGDVYQMTRKAIEALPQGQNTSISGIVARQPGVARDANGELHMRGEHANMQYRLNGILLPEGLKGFGQVLEARLADRIDVMTGTLPAQYAYWTAGVVDIHTKTGTISKGGLVDLYGGSRGTWSPSVDYGGQAGRLSYFVTGTWTENDLGVAAPDPSPTPVHDHTLQQRAFGYFTFPAGSDAVANLAVGTSSDRFQIPSPPGQAPQYQLAGHAPEPSQFTDENQREVNHWMLFGLKGLKGTQFGYQFSVFSRYSSIHFTPDPVGDLIYNGVASDVFRSSFSNGVQGDLTWWTSGRHTIRAGFYASGERAISDNSAAVFPGDPGAQASLSPFSIVDDHSKTAWLYGLYVQDEWRPSDRVTVNAGLRGDLLDGYTRSSQLSPRVGLVWRLSKRTSVHAGYARYFTPPPTELIAPTSIEKFRGTTNALPSGANTSVVPERSHSFDLGLIHSFSPRLEFSLDGYYKIVQHLLDEGQFGQALIYAPFNYKRGKVYGLEFSGSYRRDGFSAYVNGAWSVALGRTVASGQYNFDADELAYIADHWVHLDHDQTWTASAGASYEAGRLTFTADVLYGSGLRAGFANIGHVPATLQCNVGGAWTFKAPGLGRLKGRVSVLNVFDRVNLLRDGTGIGVFAPQYAPRRAVYLGLSKAF